MRQVFGGWGVVAETKGPGSYDMETAPVAAISDSISYCEGIFRHMFCHKDKEVLFLWIMKK